MPKLPLNQRLKELTSFERQARKDGYSAIAGVDEAGRGPLAGPVVAAACILPENVYLDGIDDSKKLSPKEREKYYNQIIENPEILYGVGVIESIIIDQINILQATFRAMIAAILKLSKKPDLLLVDGPLLPRIEIPSKAIVDGDALSQSIMAAAIIAKCTRDHLMVQYHAKWPEYGFAQHKGYGTPQHLEALKHHGPCPIHRKTFAPIKELIGG